MFIQKAPYPTNKVGINALTRMTCQICLTHLFIIIQILTSLSLSHKNKHSTIDNHICSQQWFKTTTTTSKNIHPPVAPTSSPQLTDFMAW